MAETAASAAEAEQRAAWEAKKNQQLSLEVEVEATREGGSSGDPTATRVLVKTSRVRPARSAPRGPLSPHPSRPCDARGRAGRYAEGADASRSRGRQLHVAGGVEADGGVRQRKSRHLRVGRHPGGAARRGSGAGGNSTLTRPTHPVWAPLRLSQEMRINVSTQVKVSVMLGPPLAGSGGAAAAATLSTERQTPKVHLKFRTKDGTEWTAGMQPVRARQHPPPPALILRRRTPVTLAAAAGRPGQGVRQSVQLRGGEAGGTAG